METTKKANLPQPKTTKSPLASLQRIIPLLVGGIAAILAFWNYSGIHRSRGSDPEEAVSGIHSIGRFFPL